MNKLRRRANSGTARPNVPYTGPKPLPNGTKIDAEKTASPGMKGFSAVSSSDYGGKVYSPKKGGK